MRKRVRITYTQLLRSTGLVEYVYPLNTEKFSAAPLDTCRGRDLDRKQP